MSYLNNAKAVADIGVGTAAIYLWIGLKATTKQHLSDSFGGEIGIAEWIAGFAPLVNTKWASHTGEFPGVYHYEVVEKLGYWLGKHPQATTEQFKVEMDRLSALFMSGAKID